MESEAKNGCSSSNGDNEGDGGNHDIEKIASIARTNGEKKDSNYMSPIQHSAVYCDECPEDAPPYASVGGLNQHRRNHDLSQKCRAEDRYYSWNRQAYCVYEDCSSCRDYIAFGFTGHYGIT